MDFSEITQGLNIAFCEKCGRKIMADRGCPKCEASSKKNLSLEEEEKED